LSGASAQIGVDAQKSFDTAAEVINKNYDFDLPLARARGSKASGRQGAAGVRRPPSRSAEGPPPKPNASSPRKKVCAIIAPIKAQVAVTVSQICERYQIPFISADNSSPSSTAAASNFISAPPRTTRCSRARCSISSTP